MSFGDSPSDTVVVVALCKELIRKCCAAAGEDEEVSCEVQELHAVLRHLKTELEAPESRINQDPSLWERKVAPIIRDSDLTLRELDSILAKHGRLSTTNGGGSGPSGPRTSWDRTRLGSYEMDQLGSIRVKLISYKTRLTNLLDSIQRHHSGKTEPTPEDNEEELDHILDKVDKIATKLMQKNGSVRTNYNDDDMEVWKDFRRELIAEGFSSDVLHRHKDVLRAYIREIEQQGLLDKSPVDPVMPPLPVPQQTSRGPETMQAPARSSVSAKDSQLVDSVHNPSKEPGKMMFHEENMKFPLSMKQQRAKPESQKDGSKGSKQLEISGDRAVTEQRMSGSSQPQPFQVPRVVTTEEKEPYYINTDGSSESDTESDSSTGHRSRSSLGQIITTSALVALSQALTLHPSSPSSFKSQNSYFDDNDQRSTSHRSKQLEPDRSPYLGAISIPNPNGKSNVRLSNSPRPEPIHLAPDSRGNIIPLDAKWTKINRRLVSPEVLHQAHKRYEARPEFVAVLGVLSRAEIEDLAARSHTLREARRRKHFPPDVPPPHPPRPIPPSLTRNSSGRDTPSTDESDSDSDPKHRRPKPRGILKNSYTHQNFQQDPPSPVWSPASAERQTLFVPPREREPRRHHKHSSNHGNHRLRESNHSQDRDRDRPDSNSKEKKKKRLINGENLTFAGLGGAAMSLFHTLSEAAEGL